MKVTPYINAPKLPEGERVDIRTLVKGEWLELEVGPGRGGFLFERARAEVNAGLVGLEVRRKWASIVDARLAKQGFSLSKFSPGPKNTSQTAQIRGEVGVVFAEIGPADFKRFAEQGLSRVRIPLHDQEKGELIQRGGIVRVVRS